MRKSGGVWAAALVAAVLAGCGKPATEETAEASVAPAIASASPAPAYVGTWGVDLAQCKNPQDIMEAPMQMAADRFDQHEAHCTFTTITETAPGAWKVTQACTVEGDESTGDMTFSVEGDTLTLDPGSLARKLVRCP
jgi:hypothetical protein